MDSKKPIIVKRSNQPQALPLPQPHAQLQQSQEEVAQPEIEQPEQPPGIYLESLAEEAPKDESVYGSGWSIAQLRNEFHQR